MDVRSEDGQSLLEFLMMFPILLGLFFILLNVNMAIQSSIVNQQYTRAMTTFLTFNSPYYPERRYQANLTDSQTNQMVLGVSEEMPHGDDFQPSAPLMMITRKKNVSGSNENQSEPAFRSMVRIRNTSTLCTASWFITSKGSGQGAIGFNQIVTNTQMGPRTCGGRITYEQ